LASACACARSDRTAQGTYCTTSVGVPRPYVDNGRLLEPILVKRVSDGTGVTLGWETNESDWDSTIEKAIASVQQPNGGCWIVQERIPIRREVFPWIQPDGKVEFRDMLVSVRGNVAKLKKQGKTLEGDMRSAFYMAYDHEGCEHVKLMSPEIDKRLASGPPLVSAHFVIPYPPGFPIMVPGQVIKADTIEFMRKLDVKEIHGYDARKGLELLKPDALTKHKSR
jgi:hypothetical protein